MLPQVQVHSRSDVPFSPKRSVSLMIKGTCSPESCAVPEIQAVATELSKINWPTGGSERGLCRVLSLNGQPAGGASSF